MKLTILLILLACGTVAVLVLFFPMNPTSYNPPRLGEQKREREQPNTAQAVEKQEAGRTELVTPPSALVHQPVPKYYHDYTRDGYVVQFNPNGLGSFEVVVGHPMGWRMDSVDVGEVRIQSDNAAIVPFLEIQHQYNVALNDPGLEYVRRALADPTPFALVLLSCNEYDPSDKCRVLAVVATRFSASP